LRAKQKNYTPDEMMNVRNELFPDSRTGFLSLVKKIARQDVKKCMAGIHVTHPQLIQHVKQSHSRQQQQHAWDNISETVSTVSYSPSSTDTDVSNQENIPLHNEYHSKMEQKQQTGTRLKSNKSDIVTKQRSTSTPLSDKKNIINNRSVRSVMTKEQKAKLAERARERAEKAEQKFVLRRRQKHEKDKEKDQDTSSHSEKHTTNQPTSEHLLRPTFSIAQKYLPDEREPVISENKKKDYRAKRKEQKRATSLLLDIPKKKKHRSHQHNRSIDSVYSEESESPRYTPSPDKGVTPERTSEKQLSQRVFTMSGAQTSPDTILANSQSTQEQQTSPVVLDTVAINTDESVSRHLSSSVVHSPPPSPIIQVVEQKVQKRSNKHKQRRSIRFEDEEENEDHQADQKKRQQHTIATNTSNPLVSSPVPQEPTSQNRSTNVMIDEELLKRLENELMEDILREVAKTELEDGNKYKSLLEDRIKLTMNIDVNDEKIDEIMNLLDVFEKQEHDIRQRFVEAKNQSYYINNQSVVDAEFDNILHRNDIHMVRPLPIFSDKKEAAENDIASVLQVKQEETLLSATSLTNIRQYRDRYLRYKELVRGGSDIAPDQLADIMNEHIFEDIFLEVIESDVLSTLDALPEHVAQSEFVIRNGMDLSDSQ
jgi:hypothetical protein